MTASDDVLDLVQRWAAAEQQNDAGPLEGLLAEGFAGVGPLGFALTREQWLAGSPTAWSTARSRSRTRRSAAMAPRRS